MKRLISLLMCSSFMGCWQFDTSDPHFQVYVDPNFESDYHQAVQDSIANWQQAVGDVVTFSPTQDWQQERAFIFIGPSTIAELTNESDALMNDPSEQLGLWTYKGKGSSLIQVAVDQSLTLFQITVEHELGHALGLDHTGPGTIMYSKGEGVASHITCGDVEQFCAIWNCKMADMPPCQEN